MEFLIHGIINNMIFAWVFLRFFQATEIHGIINTWFWPNARHLNYMAAGSLAGVEKYVSENEIGNGYIATHVPCKRVHLVDQQSCPATTHGMCVGVCVCV